MAIADFSTTVEARQTAMEIFTLLQLHDAKNITIEYDNNDNVTGLSFSVPTSYGDLPIRIPIDIHSTIESMKADGLPPRYWTYQHAAKVAWRITKDWIRAQLAYVDTKRARMEQVFLPYMLTGNNRTLYEAMVDKQFQLTEGNK